MSTNSGGRPPLPDALRTVRKQFYLTPAQFEYLARMGDGNPSVGLRAMVDAAMKGQKR